MIIITQGAWPAFTVPGPAYNIYPPPAAVNGEIAGAKEPPHA